MQNIQTLGITEGQASDAIFDACRANPNREAKANVTFRIMANGNHEATLRNADGEVVAIAHVDEFDN